MSKLLSIIVSVRNSRDELVSTIDSIARNTSSQVEYIVIDGFSSDGSFALVQCHRELFSVAFSEKDHGLYDALNKGVIAARGTFVGILNAGDQLIDLEGVLKVLNPAKENTAYFARSRWVFNRRSYEVPRKSDIPEIYSGAKNPPHGAVIAPRSFCLSERYDEKYKIAGDTDWLSRLRQQVDFKYIDTCLVRQHLGGMSNWYQDIRHWKTHTAEKIENFRKYGGSSHASIITSMVAKYCLQKILPPEKYFDLLYSRHWK